MTDTTYEDYIAAADAAYKRGDYASAAAGYENALVFDPNNHDLRAIYARASGASGNLQESLSVSQRVLGWQPDHAMALATACAAAFALGRWRIVAELGPRWLERGDDTVRASRMLSQAYVELGQMKDAQALYLAVAEDDADNPENWVNYARIALGAFDYLSARKAIDKAHELAAPTAASLFTLGRMHFFLGQMNEAEKFCHQAIETDSEFVPAYGLLTTIRHGDVSDSRLQDMKTLSAQTDLSSAHRSSLNFAIGDILHRRAQYQDAMAHFTAGNALAHEILEAQGMAYRADPVLKEFENAKAAFSNMPEPLQTKLGAQPIFIVGMPRSGTTLIESILSEHEDVYGAGELQSMRAIHQELLGWSVSQGNAPLSDLPRAELERARDWYLEALPERDHRFVVDKQPLNFRSVPLIKVLFPESPIVHARRNPIDTGFSIFRLDFAKTWPYATSFDDIANFYGAYARWSDEYVSEDDLFQYEALITQFETEARRLLDHCGLEWREACLNFHQTLRPVTTFSAAQVRQPLRRTPDHVIERYGPALDPLVSALSSNRIDLETGALLGSPA
ncbi:MAG: sulfotransferase [Pseudomonadota bacterium]